MTDKYLGKYRIESTRLQKWDYRWKGYYFVTINTGGRERYFGEIVNGKMNLSPLGLLAEKYWKEIPEHFPFVEVDEFVIMPDHIHGIIRITKNVDDKEQSDNLTNRTISARDVKDAQTEGTDDGIAIVKDAQIEGLHHVKDSQFEGLDNGIAIVKDAQIGRLNSMTKTINESQTGRLNSSTKTINESQIGHLQKTDVHSKQSSGGKNDRWKSGSLGVIINQYKRKCTIESRKICKSFAWQSRYHDSIIRDDKSLNIVRRYIKNNPSKWEIDTKKD